MRAPRFWKDHRDKFSILSKILEPISWIWTIFTNLRINKVGQKVDVPIICVGNINLGGVGKTPTVIAIIEKLNAKGLKPHIISKGFGGKLNGPLLVTEKYSSDEVGDEPLLLSAFAPTWVSRDRVAGSKAAIASGCDIIILDDGFQNGSLHKDISIIVVDAKVGFGNGKIFPAGPLRESFANAFNRANLMILIGKNKDKENFYKLNETLDLPVCNAYVETIKMGINWQDTKVLAFAGIGYPDKFFDSLRELGAIVVKEVALTDHAKLTKKLMQRLTAEAQKQNAVLVTTEKDAVRLPNEYRKEVLTVPIRLIIDDWEIIENQLNKFI
jgi:tetraacyldisaccharide 4'-kinase